MDKATLMQIINSALDDSKIQAMAAGGLGASPGGMDLGQEETPGLQSWNARPLEITDAPRPPLMDPQMFKQGARPSKQEAYRQQIMAQGQQQDMQDIEGYMPQQGDDGNYLGTQG